MPLIVFGIAIIVGVFYSWKVGLAILGGYIAFVGLLLFTTQVLAYLANKR